MEIEHEIRQEISDSTEHYNNLRKRGRRGTMKESKYSVNGLRKYLTLAYIVVD